MKVIQAFDWPHILVEEYLPLCGKAIEYDNAPLDQRGNIVASEDLKRLHQLDDFLESFETLYFAISSKLIALDDVLVFFRYYVLLLGDTYFNPTHKRLRQYMDQYYCDVQCFLIDVEEQFVKH